MVAVKDGVARLCAVIADAVEVPSALLIGTRAGNYEVTTLMNRPILDGRLDPPQSIPGRLQTSR